MKTGFKISITLILAIMLSLDSFAGKRVVKLTVSEADAMIYVNNRHVGTGQCEVVIPSDQCVTVKIEKLAYLTEIIKYCNKKGNPEPPKTQFVQMERDDSWDASEATDMVNIDIEVPTGKSELEAWKLISQIVTNQFDVIEVTDRETGYLRTAWVIQHFKKNTVRSRMIVKLGSNDPLTYRVKLVSEQAGQPDASVKSEELFKEWDRVLKKYKEVIREIQTRLNN